MFVGSENMIDFIIPVYNGEKYISRCLQSIKETCNVDFNVIIVDDGSEDATESICRQIAEEDKRIKYIRQINAGVSSARNNGLKHVSGEWVMFVDADDIISFPEQLDILNEDSDIIVFSEKARSERTFYLDKMSDLSEYVSGILKVSNNQEINQLYLNAVWAKAYKTAIIKKYDVKFDEGLVNGEDTIFNMKIVNHAQKVTLRKVSVYKWYVSGKSATKKYQVNMEATDMCFLKMLQQYLNEKELMGVFYTDYLAIALNGLWIILYQSIGHYRNHEKIIQKKARYKALLSQVPYNEAIREFQQGHIRTKKRRKVVFHLLEMKLYALAFGMIAIMTKRKNNCVEYFVTI